MVQHFFLDPRTIRRLQEGPLGAYIDGLAAQLQAQGYAWQSARVQLRIVAELSRWLQRQGRSATDLSPSTVQAYLRYRRRRGLAFYPGAAAACEHCLRLLRDRGIVLLLPLSKKGRFLDTLPTRTSWAPADLAHALLCRAFCAASASRRR
jgi:hypothetical protein